MQGATLRVDGQVGEEGFDGVGCEVERVLLLVVENEAPDPVDVGLLSAARMAFATDGVPHLVEEFRRPAGRTHGG